MKADAKTCSKCGYRQPTFEPGDRVRWVVDADGFRKHETFVVAGVDVERVCRKEWAEVISRDQIVVISLESGMCYTPLPHQIELVR